MGLRRLLLFVLGVAFLVAWPGLLRLAPRVSAQIPALFGAQRVPDIEVDDKDHLFLTMSAATNFASAGTPGSQTFITLSTDGGHSWNNLPKTQNLSNDHGEAFGPSLALTRSGKTRAFIVYHDDSGGTTQTYFVRSKKNINFGPPFNITPGREGAFFPRIAIGSTGNLFVVWGDTANGGKQIILLRSSDFGNNFGNPQNISQSTGEAFLPWIAVDGSDGVNVVWEDTAPGVSSIMFSRSIDGGATFSKPVKVSTGTGSANEARIAADSSGGLDVAWIDQSTGDPQLMFSRSTDSGTTFSSPVAVTSSRGALVHKPSIAVFGRTVYLAYNDDSVGQVFLTQSPDLGASFSRSVQVSNANIRACGDISKCRAHSASIAVDSTGRLHIVWIDASIFGNDEGILFYANTTDGTKLQDGQQIFAAL
jgi:hypothetical protein